MKKILVSLLAAGLLFSFAASDASAKGIGIKGGYFFPQGDLEKGAESTWTGGIFFDLGPAIFNSLAFRPGVDYVTWEKNDVKIANVYGIHFDWYWHFMGKTPIAPFLGFGPTLNYYSGGQFKGDNKDSDAGVDLLAGAEMAISGTPFTLLLEGRYKFYDIADRDVTAVVANIGVLYKF